MSLGHTMAIDHSSLTPQQRLAISRRALFNQIESVADHDAGHMRPAASYGDRSYIAPSPSHPDASRKKRGLLDGLPWVKVAQSFGARWWRRHPANAMVQLAHPLLQRYARKQPAKLIAIAAGTGAVLMLVKPWRLLSVTALAAAVLKTSDVADMVTTLMNTQMASRRDDPQ
jgi:hypothetical protein